MSDERARQGDGSEGDGASRRRHSSAPHAETVRSVADSGAAADAAAAPPAADLDARFEVLEQIGSGGMGRVLRARDRTLHREVAVKVPRRARLDAIARTRFLAEARITGGLEHPNIVPVHEAGEDVGGRPYFTMRLVRGEDLADVLQRLRDSPHAAQVWPLSRLLRVLAQVCNAVAFAHAHGVVHRDLKPANIMLGAFGEVLVMDWGLAKMIDAAPDDGAVEAPTPRAGEEGRAASGRRTPTSVEITRDGIVVGTPGYLSPEQALGQRDLVDVRSDVYALGAILYEILTLRRPIEAETVAEAIRLAAVGEIAPPEARAGGRAVPPELSAIAMKALARDRDERYPTASALRHDLERFLDDRDVVARPDGVGDALRRLIRRNPAASLAVSLAIATVAVIASVSYVANLEERRTAEEQRGLADHQRARAEALATQAEAARASADAALAAERAQRAEAASQDLLANLALAAGHVDDDEFLEARLALDRCGADQRGWTWRRLARLCSQASVMVRGHLDAVCALAVTPDGCRLVTGDVAGVAVVWAWPEGRELSRLEGHDGVVRCAAFIGRERVATGCTDGALRLWDAGGSLVATLYGHDGAVAAIAALGDDTVLTGGDDGTVRRWDLSSRRDLVVARGAAVTALAVRRDGAACIVGDARGRARVVPLDGGAGAAEIDAGGRVLAAGWVAGRACIVAVGVRAGTARTFDIARGTPIAELSGPRSAVASAAFADDGRVVTGGYDHVARVYSPQGEEQLALHGHAARVSGVAFVPRTTQVVTCGDDWAVAGWDTSRDPATGIQRLGTRPRSAAIAPDGAIALADDSGARLLRAGDARASALAGARTIAIGDDGASLCVADGDGAIVVASDVAERRFAAGGVVRRIAWMRGGDAVALALEDGRGRVLDAHDGSERFALYGHVGAVTAIAVDPAGALLATGGEDGSVRLWSARDGEALATLTAHTDVITAVRFSSDGRALLSSDAGVAVVWDVAARRAQASLRGPTGRLVDVAFSPDEPRAVTASADGSLRMWDLRSGRFLFAMREHHSSVLALGFAGGGELLSVDEEGVVVRRSAFAATPPATARAAPPAP